MSGGSYDYAYTRIEEIAEMIELRAPTPVRLAFAAHLRKCAEAAKAIEWVDSMDRSPGDEDEPIRACIAPEADIEVAVNKAREAAEQLQSAIARVNATPRVVIPEPTPDDILRALADVPEDFTMPSGLGGSATHDECWGFAAGLAYARRAARVEP